MERSEMDGTPGSLQDSNAIPFKVFKNSSVPGAEALQHDVDDDQPETIIPPSPQRSPGNTDAMSSPRPLFLHSRNGSQQTLTQSPTAGSTFASRRQYRGSIGVDDGLDEEGRRNASSTYLNQSSRAGGFSMHSRNSSAQFLIAHGRSRAASKFLDGDTGLSRNPTQFESTEHQIRGRHRSYIGSHPDLSVLARKSYLGGLFKPPVIRQFLHNGHLYKEEEERGLSHFELFADLVFVAIIRIFGEVAAEEATVSNGVKFMLMFWPPYGGREAQGQKLSRPTRFWPPRYKY